MAGIAFDIIGIVAGFKAFSPFFQVEANDPIAAGSQDACVATAIIFAVITIIADFGAFDSPIATELETTQGIATVAVDHIGVIAFLWGFFIGAHNTITASCYLAVIGAAITISAVAIVAGFVAFPDITITAASGLAAAGAVIGFNVIAIIAALTAGLA